MEAVIGLGSNLGDRRSALAGAVRACARLGDLLAVSSLYETAPVGPPQPAYLNAALLLRTELEPDALFDRLLAIEREHGRVRAERWGPRTLDLDLLLIVGRSVQSERLTVPHPALAERAFALLPLLEVAPDAREPSSAREYRDIASGVDRSGVSRSAPSNWWRDAKIL
jgi:2-amino-4-hydroxy-6-hydroxymethyldihydropteridine diphosphokinase